MARWSVRHPQTVTLNQAVHRVAVRLVSGRLSIVGTTGPARVEVARVGSRPVAVDCEGATLTVGLDRPPRWPWLAWWGRRYAVDVSIAVPRETVADLRLTDGSVVASGLTAGCDVSVTSGRVTLLGMDGRVRAKLISGPVEALGVAGELTMETVSGELTLADSAAGRVLGTTVSGAITCDLDNPAGSEIRLSTTSGDITVRVREDSDLSVRLHTASGRITTAFPGLPVDRGVFGIKDVDGVLGGGAGKLWAGSTSGNLALLARPVGDEP